MRYLNGDFEGQQFARLATGGSYEFILQDRQGSVREVVSISGGMLKQLSYDAFGNITMNTGSGNIGWWTFGHYYFDTVSGNVKMRWRDTNPLTNRFQQVDPIGTTGGDANFYRLAGNGGVNATDRNGLQEDPLTRFYRDIQPSIVWRTIEDQGKNQLRAARAQILQSNLLDKSKTSSSILLDTEIKATTSMTVKGDGKVAFRLTAISDEELKAKYGYNDQQIAAVKRSREVFYVTELVIGIEDYKPENYTLTGKTSWALDDNVKFQFDFSAKANNPKEFGNPLLAVTSETQYRTGLLSVGLNAKYGPVHLKDARLTHLEALLSASAEAGDSRHATVNFGLKDNSVTLQGLAIFKEGDVDFSAGIQGSWKPNRTVEFSFVGELRMSTDFSAKFSATSTKYQFQFEWKR